MFGDSTPAEMFEVHMLAGKKESPVAWSYVAHMPEFGSEDMHDEITDDHQIVLYHYVTRSQQEFVERKLTHTNLGAYSADFAEAVGDNSTVPVSEHPDLDRLYADFERKHGFDGTHAICSQATHVAAAMNAARDDWGWDAFTPHSEGPQ